MNRLLSQYPPQLRMLALAMAINVTGMSFVWPLNTIYVHQVLGMSMTMAGLVLLLNQGAALLGNLLGGAMFDRLGGRKTVSSGIVLAIIAVTVMGLLRSFPIYVAAMGLLGLGFGIIFPAVNALAGSIWPEGGRKAMNLVYVAQNLGVAIGSAIGGILASYSFTVVFLSNALFYLGFLLLFLRTFAKNQTDTAKVVITPDATLAAHPSEIRTVPSASSWGSKNSLISLAMLSIGFMIGWVAYVQWQATISIYIQTIGVSLSEYSLLWTINGAVIVLGQPMLAWFIRHVAPSTKRQIVYGILTFAISFAIVANANMYWWFVIAMLIMTFGEMLAWPGVPALAADLAPTGMEGRFQGLVSSAATAGRMIGPLVGGFLYEATSPLWLYSIMIGFTLLAAIVFSLYDFAAKSRSKHGPYTHSA